jgi:hypothetical protein
MKIVSFDIGIKNMAFCLFDVSGSHLNIIDWTVLNLMDEEAPKQICNCSLLPKNKKTPAKPCAKAAKYKKLENFYCEKHAKTNKEYQIPTRESSLTSIKKLKIEHLKGLCAKHNISLNGEIKAEMIGLLQRHFSLVNFEYISESKKMSAGDVDLIVVGKNMTRLLNENENLTGVDVVIIENQISPIANRMKTIQGMLTQYFIMKSPQSRIEFVSSANKLKSFQPLENSLRTEDGENTYKANKKNGVEYCSRFLNENPNFENWKSILETKKKDDLADAFLQGMWYIRNKMNIMRMT